MADVIDITLSNSPVTVGVTAAPASPVLISVAGPISVAVGATLPTAPVVLNVASTPVATTVNVTAGAQGVPGVAGTQGVPGVAGANAQIVMLASGAAGLSAYFALSPAAQTNGTWYVVPKA